MHGVKPNYRLQWIAAPLLLVADFILARYYPHLIMQLYGVHGLFLIAVIAVLFSPLGQRRLVAKATERPRFTLKKCLVLILLFELSVMALFYGLASFIQLLQPEVSASPFMWTREWVLQWGLFPWAAVAFIAGSFAYYAHIKQRDTFMNTPLFPLFKSSGKQPFGITANVCSRLNVFLVLVTSLMIGSLWLAWIFTHWAGLQLLYGLNLECILVMTAILVVVGHRKLGVRLFNQLMQWRCPLIAILTTACVMIAVLLLIGSGLLHGVKLHPVTLPHWLVKQAPVEAIFKLFLALWALAWVPLAGVFIAYVSRGHTLYQLILAVLALPALGSIFLVAGDFSQMTIAPGVAAVVSLVGLAVLLSLLFRQPQLAPLFAEVYVAADDIKYEDNKLYMIKLIRMTVGLLYLYVPGGVLLLGLLSAMYAWPNVIYLILILLSTVFAFKKE